MGAERLMRDEVSRTGQHWIEVMRMGARVDPGPWIARAPQVVDGLVHAFERYEMGLDVWRLYVRWPAREWVKVAWGCPERAGQEGILWYLDPGQSIRNGLENAAALFWMRFEVWPLAGFVWKNPPESRYRLEDASNQEGTDQWLELRCGLWVPKGYVAIGSSLI